jgi:hypothetical protein
MVPPALDTVPAGAGALLLPARYSKTLDLEAAVREAKSLGALYHPTHPFDAWYCRPCGVFGRSGSAVCWCCGSESVERQWLPRLGGGAETVTWEPPPPSDR